MLVVIFLIYLLVGFVFTNMTIMHTPQDSSYYFVWVFWPVFIIIALCGFIYELVKGDDKT